MSTNEQARERLAQQRHQEEHLKETMLNRSEAEIQSADASNHTIDEQAREALTDERQHEAHLKETMLDRAQSEIQS